MKRVFLMLSIAVLAIAGCGTSLITEPEQRSTVAGDSEPLSVNPGQPTELQQETDSPVFTVEDLARLRQEESAKTAFSGEFGGVTFRRSVSAHERGCGVNETVDEVAAETLSSPLILKGDLFPADFTLSLGDKASVCGSRVIAYAIRALGPRRGNCQQDIRITRLAGRVVASDEPLERFSQVTVAGEDAVLIKGLPIPGAPAGEDPFRWKLVILEDFGVTVLESRWVKRDELLSLAERLIHDEA